MKRIRNPFLTKLLFWEVFFGPGASSFTSFFHQNEHPNSLAGICCPVSELEMDVDKEERKAKKYSRISQDDQSSHPLAASLFIMCFRSSKHDVLNHSDVITLPPEFKIT
jgi:hypothetical protein